MKYCTWIVYYLCSDILAQQFMVPVQNGRISTLKIPIVRNLVNLKCPAFALLLLFSGRTNYVLKFKKSISHLRIEIRHGCIWEFLLTPMGVLAPGSAHARPSAQPPIDVSGNFPPHVSAESPSYISPNCLELISKVSENLKNIKNKPKKGGF